MSTVVLHNLPVGCMESDIHRALLIYGSAVRVEMNTPLSQAVVTMRTQQEAQALLNRHSVNVSGTSVRVDTQQTQQPLPTMPPQPQQRYPQQQQYTPNPPSHGASVQGYGYANPQGAMYTGMVPAHQAAPQQQQQQQPYYPQSMRGGAGESFSALPASQPQPQPHVPSAHTSAILPAPPQTSRRLKVVVEDCRYPITRDVLLRMFSMIATPVMVTCGPYGPTTTGMVEFADAASAQQAVEQYHSKAIYPDCCYVQLLFEPMWEVPASGASVMGGSQSAMRGDYMYGSGYGQQAPPSPAGPPARHAGWDPREETGALSGDYGSGPYAQLPQPRNDRTQGPPHGGGGEMADYGSRAGVGRGSGRGGGEPYQSAGLMVRGGRGVVGGRGAARGGAGVGGHLFTPYGDAEPSYSSPAPFPHHPSRASGDVAGGTAIGGRPPAAVPPPSNSAVLVSGVPTTVPLYDLWVLLEVYGNVKSLKRQLLDRTQVVAQFFFAADTVTAVQYLHGCTFHGSQLRLKRFMGYQERPTEWNVGPPTDPATLAVSFERDFHHRFSPLKPRNPRSAVHPSPNLFLCNLTDKVTDAEVDALLRAAGVEPLTSFRRGPKATIVGFKDVETTVRALVAMHLKDVNGASLYASFSRFPPGPRPARKEGEEADHEDEMDGAQEEGEGVQGGEEKQPASTPSAEAPAESPAPVESVEEAAAEAADSAPASAKRRRKNAKK